MKVFKPMGLGLLTRPYEHRNRFRLGIAVLAFVPIGEPALLSEIGMWQLLSEELPPDQAVDAGIPKERGEVLLAGYACAPAGTTVPALRVSVMLGEGRKSLHVFGDRHWVGDAPSDPAPFQTMRVDWAHAFGGPGHPDNPAGMGARAVATPDGARTPLPNVVEAGEDAGRFRRPAGFGALDVIAPQRARSAGTHDDRWLNEDFPGFARDIDWRFFNVAPNDQQFAGPLRGDEAYAFENMHPAHRVLRGQLPGLMPRAFVVRHGTDTLEEAPLSLTTVWCFPHRERLVLVHHGAVDVAEEDGSDIARILIGADRQGQPRDPALFHTVMAKRMDPVHGGLHALRDKDLVPADLIVPDPGIAAELAKATAGGLHQKHAHVRIVRAIEAQRAELAARGFDPDQHALAPPPPPPPEPSLDDLPAMLEQLTADAERAVADAKLKEAEAEVRGAELLASTGSTMTMDQIRGRGEHAVGGPPTFTAAAARHQLEAFSLSLRAQGLDASFVNQKLHDPAQNAHWEEAEASLRDLYCQSAHLQHPARRAGPERHAAARGGFAGPRRSWAGANLCGLDLSGLDLSGLDFAGAWLDNAILAGADLRGAKLAGAVLAHADLQGCRLDGADLHGANLGRTRLRGATLEGARLTEAVLGHADLRGAVLSGADLTGADLQGAQLAGVDLRRAQAPDLTVMSADLAGLQAAGAVLDRVNFMECALGGADLSGASCEGMVFYKVLARNLQASGARLRKACFVDATDLAGASFAGADLAGANLRGVSLAGADLSGAVLDDADLSGCDLSGASLHRVHAHRARFVAANMQGADLRGADLMHATLSRADLRGADLTGASLYEADAARVLLDRGARVGGTLTTRTRTRPRARA